MSFYIHHMFQSFSLFTRELRAMSLAVAFLGFVLFALFFHSGRQHLKTGRNNFVCPRFRLTELMFQLCIFPFHIVCYSNFAICILIFLIPRKPNCKCSFPLNQCDNQADSCDQSGPSVGICCWGYKGRAEQLFWWQWISGFTLELCVTVLPMWQCRVG